MFCQNITVLFQLIYDTLVQSCIVSPSTNTSTEINESSTMPAHFRLVFEPLNRLKNYKICQAFSNCLDGSGR